MNVLVLLGLGFDLVGVLFLGFDLLRVQKGIRDNAERRLTSLRSKLSEYDEDYNYLKKSRWESGNISEGLFEPDGGFDPDAAQKSFAEIVSAIEDLSERTAGIIRHIGRTTLDDKNESLRSLTLSYMGLTFVSIGFVLQILGTIFSASL